MSTLDKQTTDITESATVESPGEKDLGAVAACGPQQNAPALEARSLTLVWGNGQVVAKDISIELQPGYLSGWSLGLRQDNAASCTCWAFTATRGKGVAAWL